MYPAAVAALGLVTLVRGVPNEINKRLDNGVGVTPAMGWNNYNAGLGMTTYALFDMGETNSVQVQQPKVLWQQPIFLSVLG